MIITGGEYKGRKLFVPDEKVTRPTLSKVRQGVFNVLYSELGRFDDKSFLDLFGGSGIMGLEALSRGFKDVTVFEKNQKSAQIIKKNYSTLGLKPNLKIGDSIRFLEKLEEIPEVIYIDPPYYSGIYDSILLILSQEKFSNSIIVVEHSEALDTKDFRVLKLKNYGGKLVTFLAV
jgi:16S rRNA (guanine(966)-N(2))-methyltransferase RsmD